MDFKTTGNLTHFKTLFFQEPVKRLLHLILAVTAITGMAFAKVITVDNKAGSVAMFTSVQAAVDAAEVNDTILIAGSATSYGQAHVTKKLHFVGPGYFLQENSIPGITKEAASVNLSFDFIETQTFQSTSAASTCRGLTITAFWKAGRVGRIFLDQCRIGRVSGDAGSANPVTITRCWVESFGGGSSPQANYSIIRSSSIGTLTIDPGTTVEHCVISGQASSAVESSISNCTFVTTSDAPGDWSATLKGSVTYSMVAGGLNARGKASPLPPGVGNVPTIAFVADVFEQGLKADQIYRLKAGSPAIGIGLNGVDLGMFGGPTPYLISGVPARPRITHLVSPSSATSTSGLRFEVEARSF